MDTAWQIKVPVGPNGFQCMKRESLRVKARSIPLNGQRKSSRMGQVSELFPGLNKRLILHDPTCTLTHLVPIIRGSQSFPKKNS